MCQLEEEYLCETCGLRIPSSLISQLREHYEALNRLADQKRELDKMIETSGLSEERANELSLAAYRKVREIPPEEGRATRG